MFVNRISRIRRRVDFGLYEEIKTDILPLVTIKCGTRKNSESPIGE